MMSPSLNELIRPLESVVEALEWPRIHAQAVRSIYAQAKSDHDFERVLKLAEEIDAERVMLNTGSHCSAVDAWAILERENKSRLHIGHECPHHLTSSIQT